MIRFGGGRGEVKDEAALRLPMRCAEQGGGQRLCQGATNEEHGELC